MSNEYTVNRENSSVKFDRVAISTHFSHLHHAAARVDVLGGKLCLAVYGEDPDTGKKTANVQHFEIGDHAGMTAAAMAFADAPHANIYAPYVVFNPETKAGTRRGADMAMVLALVVDGDADKGNPAPTAPLPADYIIESSAGNFQEVLWLDRPLPPIGAAAYGNALKRATGADCASDVGHVWRVPGTLNWPNATKLARGRSREPQRVTVKQAWTKWTSVDALRTALELHWREPRLERIGTAREAPKDFRPADGLRAAKVLAMACRNVARIGKGNGLNEMLYRQANRIGRYVGAGAIGYDVAFADIYAACKEAGGDDDAKDTATIERGLNDGAQKPVPDMFAGIAAMVAPPLAPDIVATTAELFKSSAAFVQEFVPPDYLVDSVLQKRFCYSVTAKTGVGKTTVAILISAHVATGRRLGGLDVEKGTVLYLAGENPTDIQMRWLGLTQEMGIDPATADVHFLPGVVALSQNMKTIEDEVTKKNLQLALVVVDTAAAFFEGDEDNSNTQQAEHARRYRSLTTLPGGPCVLVLCHPTKHATDEDLIPRGGGAFLNEVDGNIALRKRESLLAAEALGKFRGPAFDPINFELKVVQHPALKDSKGRAIPTIVARAIGDAERAAVDAAEIRDEDKLLRLIETHPRASLRAMGAMLGWKNHSKVERVLKILAHQKLIRKEGRFWRLTQAGEKELNAQEATVPALSQGILPGGPLPPIPGR